MAAEDKNLCSQNVVALLRNKQKARVCCLISKTLLLIKQKRLLFLLIKQKETYFLLNKQSLQVKVPY